MTGFPLEQSAADLAQLMAEVLGTLTGEDAEILDVVCRDAALTGTALAGPVACSQVVIHAEGDVDQPAGYHVVSVRMGVAAAGELARLMMDVDQPIEDDVLDAVGELGNIVGGNVKSMLGESSRLSLPSAEFTTGQALHEARPAVPTGGEPDAVRVTTAVLGHPVELLVRPGTADEGLFWPGAGAHGETAGRAAAGTFTEAQP